MSMRRTLTSLMVVLLASGGVSCSSPSKQSAAGSSGAASPSAAKPETGDEIPPSAYEAALPEDIREKITESFTGDLDGLVQRRMIRAGVPFNRTFYFIDHGTQRGLSYEYAMLVRRRRLNKKLKTGNLKVHCRAAADVARPAAAGATGGQDRHRDRAADDHAGAVSRWWTSPSPTRTNISEVLVTAPGVPAPATVDDLSGRSVFVRKTSSYYESLEALNQSLQAKHKKPVDVQRPRRVSKTMTCSRW